MKKIISIWLVSLLFIGFNLSLVKAQADHVVINEIQVAGETARDEFVELYNPTNSDIDISGWSMQYKSATGENFLKKNFVAETIIPANGYYVVAHKDFTGLADMAHSSFSIASAGGNIYLVNSHDKLAIYYDPAQVIDHVAWGTGNDPEGSEASVPTALSSISRTNGQDTDNNASDFVILISTPGQPNSSQGSGTSEQEETIEEEEIIEDTEIIETENQENENPTEEEEVLESEQQQEDEIIEEENQEEILNDEENFSEETSTPSNPPLDKGWVSTGNVVINELIPNPEGLDSQGEWIELKNIDSEIIDLDGWQLADTSKSYALSADDFTSLLLETGDYLVIPRALSKLALNNTGREALSLVDSAGRVIDMVVYEEEIPENQSYARSDGGFFWTTTLTKGAENIITQEQKNTQITETEEESIENENQENENLVESDETSNYMAEQDYSLLIINELLPNPEGDDSAGEWIELYNKGDLTIDLAGVKVGDSSSKVYEINNGRIDAQGYYLIHREVSNIALNNNGDEAKLWSADGSLIASTRYFGTAVSGEAYAFSKASGLWDWTVTPTPGETNIFSQVLGVETRTDETVSRSPASSYKRSIKPNFLSNNTISLADVKSLKVGDELTTQGVVAVEPAVFGKTYFYIVDGNYGIRVYSSKSDFPELKIGDLVQVSGSLSKSNEELRIKISQAADIQVMENTDPPDPVEVELSEIGESLEGSLVQIFGEVTSVKSSNIYLDDEAAEARVYLAAGTEIDQSIYRSGDKLQVIGLLSETKAGYRIMPRSADDIRLINQTVAGAVTESVLVKNRSSQTNPLVYFYLIIGSGVIAGFILLNRKYNWLNFLNKQKD